MKFRFLFSLILTLVWAEGEAASEVEIQPQARFSKDTIRIGEPVRLALWVKYPSPLQLLFPDTSFSFAPFELRKREYFFTRTIGELSRDCVVYELATFQLDSVQSLQLPVFGFPGQDSVRWLSNSVQVSIQPVFQGALPKEPVFQIETSPIPVALRINYPYILTGMGLVLLLILVINLFFDRPIQKFIYLFIEKRRHNTYLKAFEKLERALEQELTIENMEGLLNIWKKYIQRVDGNPYTSLTSMEIYRILPDSRLRDVLQEIDRWIYGGLEMKDFRFNIDYVRQISLQLYQKKREAIRNGKFE